MLAKTGNIFCEKKFWYIYVQNNTSLTHQKFQEQNLVMLDIVKRRMCLFKQDSFICRESMKLFLNLYIEFWFRAKESKIQPYHDSQTYIQFMRTLKVPHISLMIEMLMIKLTQVTQSANSSDSIS